MGGKVLNWIVEVQCEGTIAERGAHSKATAGILGINATKGCG